MPVDKAELAKDLDTPEYQAIAKEALSKKEFTVRTKEEETTFQERFKTDVIEKEIPGKIKAVHDQYDKDTKELFGVDRKQDEKSYDYLKRAAKERLTEYDTLKTEVSTLKEQIKKGDPTGALQKQLEETEARAKTALEEKDKKIAALESEGSLTKKETKLMTDYADIKLTFKKDLPALFSISEKAILEGVLKNSILKDGVLYAANADGSIKKDTSFKEITVKDELALLFKDVVDAAKKQGGTGSKSDNKDNIDPSKLTLDSFSMPADVKTKDELMTHMIGIGLLRGTTLFTQIWDKYSKDLKLA